ncbi:MAG: hypothetical protein AAB794_02325 [Patescibacteria group bacterium]
MNKIKVVVWKVVYFLFPSLQTFLLKSHLIWHKHDRQRYHIGWLVAGGTLEQLKKHLSEKWNFGNHFVAWKDNDQVLSWRRLENFEEQWHLRVYVDGEIRGHYEKTPEASPLQHFREIGEIDRTDDFKKFLGAYCVDQQSPMHLAPDQTMLDPVSEITISQSAPATFRGEPTSG